MATLVEEPEDRMAYLREIQEYERFAKENNSSTLPIPARDASAMRAHREHETVQEFIRKFAVCIRLKKYNMAARLFNRLTPNQQACLYMMGRKWSKINKFLTLILPTSMETDQKPESQNNEKIIFVYWDVNGMKNTKKKFTYKVTAAVKVVNNTIYAGFALCTERDVFEKKIGRKIATGRLEKNPIEVATLARPVSEWKTGRVKDKLVYNEVLRYIEEKICRKLMVGPKRRSSSIGAIITGKPFYGIKGPAMEDGLGKKSLLRTKETVTSLVSSVSNTPPVQNLPETVEA